jgi:(1->4)-alpha-D-glucan 1-alpha-D-glucosylmutase
MRIPRATYRLQLGPDLTFEDAAGLVDYLAALGVSDVYTSPFFEAASPGSHGYDVSDHTRLREELGGEAGFARFAGALRARALGLLIDVVPNHMGITHNRNAWWRDVLAHGQASPYAKYFDIDWSPVKAELAGKVLLPILGDHYGAVLDSGQLTLALEDGRFIVRYYEATLPIAPRSGARILAHRLEALQERMGLEHPDLLELKSVVAWFATLTPPADSDAERIAAARRDAETGRERLLALLRGSAPVRAFVDETVRAFNGTPGDPRSFDLLDGLLADQAYRIAFWRVAGEEINYRRFFDINELAAIRMEDPEVFAETHRLIFRLVGEGTVTGLRIDHPDGLYDPAGYFTRLQAGCAAARPGAAPDDTFYIVAEKILAPGELLPETWATSGTTGYEFLNLVNGIFVDRTQARAMEQLYARLIRVRPAFTEIVVECKRLITETSMASELNVLAHRLDRISEKHRSSRDFTLGSLLHALREIIAAFPVYRTYVGEAGRGPSDADREYIARAVAAARRRTPVMNASIYDWIEPLLTLTLPAWAEEAERRERLDFVMRFQQITGPVMAKGYEDTALYRFNRLVSLNEVGGDPSRFGTSIGEFHAENAARCRRSPHALSATATHDTKRGEDVRARIAVLSDIPHDWRRHVLAWQKWNRKHRETVDGVPTPGANTEYLIYQTLVGAWPLSADRLREYVLKAVHEAKSHTSWINPNTRYDEALARFLEAILDPARASAFLEDFCAFHARIAYFGALNSLAQVLVKVAAPGVPDFYQGTELWDLSLVDPDNRRPVDFAHRRRLLTEIETALAAGEPATLAQELLKTLDDGRIKMYVIRQALALRRARAALFATGRYRALEVRGPFADHVCAFARIGDGGVALTIVPRLLARRGLETAPVGPEYWADTAVEIPADAGRHFVNVLTGERLTVTPGTAALALPLGDVFAMLPVALLDREAA